MRAKKIIPAFLLTAITFTLAAQRHVGAQVFEENKGQVHFTDGRAAGDVLFSAQRENVNCFFRKGGFSLVLVNADEEKNLSTVRVDFDLPGAARAIAPVHENNYSVERHRLFNTCFYGITKQDMGEQLIYKNVYEHVDLVFFPKYTRGKNGMTWCWIVHPGANVRSLELQVNGVAAERETGFSYGLRTPFGAIRPAGAVALENLASGPFDFGYDHERGVLRCELNNIVLPAQQTMTVSNWCTFAGGSDTDELTGIELFANGDQLVTGYTASVNFPTGVGTVQTSNAGSYDALIMRLDSTGNRVWATYFGGTNFDASYHGVIVDGNVYVSGSTNSANFPADSTAWQDSTAGSYDAWLLKLDSSGQKIWCTLFGGSGSDACYDIDADAAGNIYIGGSTTSTNLPLAATTGFQTSWAGALDAWIAKFDSSGVPQWSTYYGGSGSEDVHALSVDASANVILCGGTYSANFPTSPGAFQSLNNGVPDIYLIKMDSAGNRVFASMYGGTAAEDAFGLDTDAEGNIYAAGFSQSLDFPMIGPSFQNMNAGMYDVCLLKVTPAGDPVWTSYYGGAQDDNAYGLFVRDSFMYVTGNTQSAAFPVSTNAFQPNHAGITDAYFIKLDTAGASVSGSFFGGTSSDVGNAIAVDAQMAAYIAGSTYSANLPATSGTMQPTYNVLGDGFVAKMDASQLPVGNSVRDIFSSEEISIYPNPFTEQLTIAEKSISSWILRDVTGRAVLRGDAASVDAGGVRAGVYVLEVRMKNGEVRVVKVMKR